MDLEQTRIFVKVIQSGGFSKAADKLKLPKSTVSRAVSNLEKETGTKLLIRTTRSLTLTPSGRAFYESTLGPITQIEEAQKSLYGKDSILTGMLKITAPEDLGAIVIAPAIAEISVLHPDLSFELIYTDEAVDLVKGGYDLAVRVGRVNESSFKIRKAAEIFLIPVASPKYLKGKKKISEPSDLQSHICLSLNVTGFRDKWTLRSSKKTVHIAIKSKIISNQMNSILNMAITGGGVGFISHFLAQPFLKSGELIRVLPEWSSPGIPVSIITPLASSSSARLKVTTDQILLSLTKTLISR
jgi:LysR family transcriptional regulator for bpeEF and oprC